VTVPLTRRIDACLRRASAFRRDRHPETGGCEGVSEGHVPPGAAEEPSFDALALFWRWRVSGRMVSGHRMELAATLAVEGSRS
jgi:hypothetical protein